ncbi:MAG TPA: hypothetical protein VJM12_01665 [Pyrinomonadaceae bacterium]|nr:hypothetical protein [Pyrinomonadaceae bacterium]
MSDVNRADVTVNLRDVHGQTITDEVEITFYNQKVQSLNLRFNVKFKGTPAVLPGVPAFPTGLAEVFIKPKRYRYKSIFMNVVGGEKNAINEDVFVDPDKARPTLMDFDDLKSKVYGTDLLRVLEKSGIKKAKWDALDKRNRATVLNLSAKMFNDKLKNGDSLISNVDSIVEKMLDKNHRERIYAIVNGNLLGALRKFPEQFRSVSGSLHKFFDDWIPVSQQNSFKSKNDAGNIQFTFATNAAGGSLADIDLDDHTGIKHAADVLRHKITGANTNPYDLHQILVYFQNIDPGYRLL